MSEDSNKPNPNPDPSLADAITEMENMLVEQDVVPSNSGREAYIAAHMDLCNAMIAQALAKYDKAKAAEAAAAKPAAPAASNVVPLKPTGGSNA